MNRHVSRLLALVRRWLTGGARDRTLDAELESFLQHEIDARVAGGMTTGDARRTALASIGGIQQVKEQAREARAGAWLDGLRRDASYAVRILLRSPGFAATAVVSLAVGIAAATGLFSLVNAALLNPFPFADVNRLVNLDGNYNGKPGGLSFTVRQLVALQQSDVLDGAFASNNWPMTLTGRGIPETVSTRELSADGFTVLGVPPLLGRVFRETDGPAGEPPQRSSCSPIGSGSSTSAGGPRPSGRRSS
jgi:hypothetical protein